MVIAKFYLAPILLFPFLGLAACGTQHTKDRRHESRSDQDPEVGGTVYSTVSGVSKSDLADEQLQYLLLCDGLATVTGTKVVHDQETLLSFGARGLSDGQTCALEVRGPERDDVEWLAGDGVRGLYYASSKAALQNSRLFAKLYKVHRVKPNEASVEVSFEDAGLCSKFNLEEHRCDDSLDSATDLFQAFGFDLGTGGQALVVSKLNTESAFAKAGLLAGDRIVMVDDREVKDGASVLQSLRGWKAKAAMPKLWLTVLRDQEAKLISISAL